MPAEGRFWQRVLRHRAPILFKECPAGLLHPRWDSFCYCRYGEHVDGWHGGVYRFATKREYPPEQGGVKLR